MINRVDMLLKEIQIAASCHYLSDLHSLAPRLDQSAKERICQIPDDRFTLDDWNKAAAYVTGTECHFSSVSEAKERIT